VILWAIVAIPLGAAIFAALPRTERYVLPVTFGCAFCVLVLTTIACGIVLRDGQTIAIAQWVGLDGFAALLELLIAFVLTTATLYSWGYIAATERSALRIRLYAANLNLFAFSLLAIPLVVEPGLAWIAVELTTLFSILLVSFDDTREALEAAWKYMLVGATAAVLGFLVLFWAMRSAGDVTFTYAELALDAPRLAPPIVAVAFFLIVIGFGAKVGFVPLHTWLPDAHSQAPSPVCALLSGIETTAVLYVIVRLMPVFRAAPLLHADLWLLVIGLLAVGVAAFLIVQTRDYKRLFAFSTVEHMGIICFAVGLGTAAAAYAAVWQMAAHALTKSFCFYASGGALAATGTRTIAEVRGLVGRTRLAAAALFVGALAVAGAPPFAVFVSEFAVARAGFASLQGGFVLIFLFFVGVAFFGLVGHVMCMIFGAPKPPQPGAHTYRLPFPARAAIVVAAIPVVVLGLWTPAPLASLLAASSAAFAR
jgi:hydrogenase-4 component F